VKLLLIAVGKRPPPWVTQAFDDYARRLPREHPLDVVELPPARDRQQSPAAQRRDEGRRLLERIPADAWVVALDERGRQLDSKGLSRRFEAWRELGRDLVLLIGGAEGLDDAVRERADEVLALSELTLPHTLARVLLVEQLYRAWTLMSGHPYHRA